MDKTNPDRSIVGLSPFQELRIIGLNLGAALKQVRWRSMVWAILLAFLTIFLILTVSYWLLDHSWLFWKAASKAVYGAGIVGFLLVFEAVYPFLHNRLVFENKKFIENQAKNSRAKPG